MATTIQFNGRTTAIPGSYSEVDASGLARVGVGATGIIALLGEVSGGAPYSEADADFDGFYRISNPGKVRRVFREGDMVEAGQMLFDATKDPNIPSSAQEVLFVKVNPSTPSERGLLDEDGNVLGTVTSRDYGAHANQLSLDIADGTTGGKLVTVYANYAGKVEEFDNVGATEWWTVSSRISSSLGELDLTLNATLFVGNLVLDAGLSFTAVGTQGTLTTAGANDEPTNPFSGPDTLELVSTNAGDTASCIVYGISGGTPTAETVVLDGTTPVTTSHTWTKVHGIYKPATTGSVVVAMTTGPVIFETLPPAETWGGALAYTADGQLEVGRGTIYFVADAATTKTLMVVGSAGGSATAVSVTLNGTTPVSSGVTTWDYIVGIFGYEVESGRTITISGNFWADDTTAELVSSSTADVGHEVYIFGMDDAGQPARELVVLNGTTAVATTTAWDMVFGWMLADQDDTAPVGTVSLRTSSTSAVVLSGGAARITHVTGAAGAKSAGRIVALGFHVGGGQSGGGVTIEYDWSGLTGTNDIYFVGEDEDGAFLAEGDDAGATDVTTGTFTRVDAIVFQGGIGGTTDNGNLLPLFSLANADFANLQAVADFFDAFEGVTFSLVTTKGSTLTLDDADQKTAVVDASNDADFYGVAWDFDWVLNNRSQYVSFALGTSTFTSGPVNGAGLFLTGGTEGTTTFADWQAALDMLKGQRVNTIVPLTSDAAVHAACVTHAQYMAGPGKSERDVKLGAASGETFNQLKTRVRELNTRHAILCHQDAIRFNTDGEREQFPPYFTACLAAGMQSGASVGEPLTWKYINLLGVVGNDASYTVIDDLDEMIQSGLFTVEPVPNIGWRWARGVTTYLIDDNLAYIESSTNHAVNLAVYEFRKTMEAVVGRKAFDGTVAAAMGYAVGILGELLKLGYIVGWQNLSITLEGDVMTVDVEIAAVVPVNFVKNTLHLVPASFAAAA